VGVANPKLYEALRRAKAVGQFSVQLVFKISNLCGRGPPTLQTADRRTDDMQSQDRALHYSASRGNKHKTRNALLFITNNNKHMRSNNRLYV